MKFSLFAACVLGLTCVVLEAIADDEFLGTSQEADQSASEERSFKSTWEERNEILEAEWKKMMKERVISFMETVWSNVDMQDAMQLDASITESEPQNSTWNWTKEMI